MKIALDNLDEVTLVQSIKDTDLSHSEQEILEAFEDVQQKWADTY